MTAWKEYLELHKDRFLQDFVEFLSIPSVSTVTEHRTDIDDAARWLVEHMEFVGLQHVEVCPTDGHPVVYGDWLGAEGAPTVLLYGHYDVQPADPLELWETPPFRPTVRNGRMYARGASDMKGNVLLMLHACEAHLQTTGKLPINVKVVIEGEEETGSPNLSKWIRENSGKLACDFVTSSDSAQLDTRLPTVIVGAKGMCGIQIDVKTHTSDLHSGLAGGIVHNALHVLADILSSMQGTGRRVAVEGFYDDVQMPSDRDRAMCQQLTVMEDMFKTALGLGDLISEPDFTPLETMWFRPTLDVNGMWGGYQDAGTKTVIPCLAHAKITCRLAANQDPARIIDVITKHVRKHTPTGVECSVKRITGEARPYVLPGDHAALHAADLALQDEMGHRAVHMRMGATVPVFDMLKRSLGVEIVSLGFTGLNDGIHAPNESVDLEMQHRGAHVFARYLERLRDS